MTEHIDPYHGIGGAYVVVDGVRITEAEHKQRLAANAAKAQAATSIAAELVGADDQAPPVAVLHRKRKRHATEHVSGDAEHANTNTKE
jgi:hypothetical protein